MEKILYILIFVSAFQLFFFLLLLHRKYSTPQDKPSIAVILFAIWIFSAIFFNGYFHQIPLLFFDLTIERSLFSIIIILTFVGLVQYLQQKLFINYTLEILMGLFTILCIFSMLQHGFSSAVQEHPSPWFVFINAYLFPFITFIFAKIYISRTKDIKLVFYIVFFSAAYLSLMAFFEFFRIDSLIFPRYIADPDVGIHFGYARGPFLNSPHMGAAILFGLACGLHLISYKRGMIKLIFSLLLAMIPFAVFFTQTRAVYLAFVVILIIFLTLYRTDFSKWKVAALPISIFIILFMAIIPILAQEDRRAGGVAEIETITIRQGLYQMSMLMFKDHPVTGVGLAQFVPTSKLEYKSKISILNIYEDAIYLHNHLLGILTELGLIGVLVYLSIIILIFKRLFDLRKYVSLSNQFLNSNFLVSIGAVWIVYLVIFQFSSPEFEVYPNALIFIFAGIVDGLYHKYRKLNLTKARAT